MRKLQISIWIILCCAVLLTACQATPDKPIVGQKDTEQLIKAVQGNVDDKTLAEMVNAPDRFVMNATDSTGTVTVNADAQIVVPDAMGMTTVRIKKREFIQAEADNIIACFIGDMDFNNRYEIGYDEMTEMLMDFQAQLVKETDPNRRAELEYSIKKFEKGGVTVPDEPEEVLPALKTFEAVDSGGEQIAGYAKDEENNIFLSIVNNPAINENCALYTKEKKGFSENRGIYWYQERMSSVDKIGLDPNVVGALPLSITKEEAQKTAQETLAALGINNMVLAVCDEVWGGAFIKGGVEQKAAHHAYQLKYVRTVGGVPITYTDAEASTRYTEDEGTPNEAFIAGWAYEEVSFIIDDTGIIEFVWQSPYDVVETVTKHSAVLPFDDISSVFSKMMMVINTNYVSEGVKETFDIKKAQLGLMRIMEKDNPDTALLIPVWDFFSDVTVEHTDDSGQKRTDTSTDSYQSLLTINAIDGSIIDREIGF